MRRSEPVSHDLDICSDQHQPLYDEGAAGGGRGGKAGSRVCSGDSVAQQLNVYTTQTTTTTVTTTTVVTSRLDDRYDRDGNGDRVVVGKSGGCVGDGDDGCDASADGGGGSGDNVGGSSGGSSGGDGGSGVIFSRDELAREKSRLDDAELTTPVPPTSTTAPLTTSSSQPQCPPQSPPSSTTLPPTSHSSNTTPLTTSTITTTHTHLHNETIVRVFEINADSFQSIVIDSNKVSKGLFDIVYKYIYSHY